MFCLAWVCGLSMAYAMTRHWFCLICIIAWIIYLGERWRKHVKRLLLFGSLSLACFTLCFIYGTELKNQREQTISFVRQQKELTISGRVSSIEEGTYSHKVILTECTYQRENQWIGCNDLLVYCDSTVPSYGSRITFIGEVKLFEQARNYGNFDEQAYYYSKKMDFACRIKEILWQEEGKSPVWNWIRLIKENIDKSICEHLSERDAGLLKAMILGDRGQLDPQIKKLFQGCGIAHILAISGLHITFMGLYLYKLLRKCGLYAWMNGLICFVVILGYGIMTGAGISTRRAIGMFVLMLIGQTIKRAEDLLNSLGLVAIFLMWENPFIITNGGFLLSIAAVHGIGLLRGNTGGLRICSMIYLVTAPLILYQFYEISLWGIIINVLILPIFSCLLGISLMSILLQLLIRWSCLWKIVEFLLSTMIWICRLADRLWGSNLIVGKPSVFVIFIFYSLFALFLWQRRQRKRGAFFCLILALSVLFFPKWNRYEVHVLDVGQGCGVHAQLKSGEQLFFDGGSTDVKNVGQYRILPFLKASGIRRIDYWFLSHLDDDHINGFLEVAASGYPISYVVLPQYLNQDLRCQQVLETLKEYDLDVLFMEAGDEVSFSKGTIRCIWPCGPTEDSNEGSLVLYFTNDKDCDILLPGDISDEVEKMLCQKGLLKEADYFIAAHHGSNGSNSLELLQEIKPGGIIISCGKNNSYGHPGERALERMKRTTNQIWMTMELGQITIGN